MFAFACETQVIRIEHGDAFERRQVADGQDLSLQFDRDGMSEILQNTIDADGGQFGYFAYSRLRKRQRTARPVDQPDAVEAHEQSAQGGG